MSVKSFEEKYIPCLVEAVKPLWGVPGGNDKFNSVDVEFIVRNNIYKNDMALELVQDDKLLAAAFGAEKGERNTAMQWLDSQLKATEFSDSEKASLSLVAEYLSIMDERTLSYMGKGDVKLSLFISRSKGCGKIILNELINRFLQKGFKNMYLWTDCTCNWQYYPRHGYELIEKREYAKFSDSDGSDFMTYIYKKSL
ncbi:MAG: hypothetical protein K6G00_04970 [Treponema sp.]|nr:hypothetical protein [Treponema sp.]